MDSKIETVVSITLTLSKEEADWLKGVMQNPLNEVEEDAIDSSMREMFWQALADPDPTKGV